MNGFEKVAVAVVRGVEAPFKYADKVEKLLATALKDEPELKTAIVGLVQRVETVVGDASADIATKGLNLPGDIQTIRDVQSLAVYVRDDFAPVVSKVWGDVAVDLKAAEVPAVPSPASVPAPLGPGVIVHG